MESVKASWYDVGYHTLSCTVSVTVAPPSTTSTDTDTKPLPLLSDDVRNTLLQFRLSVRMSLLSVHRGGRAGCRRLPPEVATNTFRLVSTTCWSKTAVLTSWERSTQANTPTMLSVTTVMVPTDWSDISVGTKKRALPLTASTTERTTLPSTTLLNDSTKHAIGDFPAVASTVV